MDNKQVTVALTEALRQVFGENTDSGKFVDVSRIPLICKNIEEIHSSLGQLDSYIRDDVNWKKEFDLWKTKVVSPIIQKQSNSEIIDAFLVKLFKVVGTTIGFLVSLGLLFHYLISPLFKL